MGVSHIVVKKSVYAGRMGRPIFLEGRISNGGGGIFWEGGVDSGSIAYSCGKGGYIPGAALAITGSIFRKGGVDYGSVAYSCQKRG